MHFRFTLYESLVIVVSRIKEKYPSFKMKITHQNDTLLQVLFLTRIPTSTVSEKVHGLQSFQLSQNASEEIMSELFIGESSFLED